MTSPPYDSELMPALASFHELTGVPRSITPQWLAQQPAPHTGLAAPVEIVEAGADERLIPGPPGAPGIAVTVLRPARAERRPLPGVLFIHGGGMIGGSRYDGLDQTLEWIDVVPMVVVSVEYRLAPGHPHPAPLDDCYTALCWMKSGARELGIDPERLLVAGASAGGGLAAATALRARDSGGPELVGQLLICPMLDDRPRHQSSVAYEGEGIWDRTSNATGWSALIGEHAGGFGVDPYAAPARADSLQGLPRTFIDVGSAETFRDEDIDYAHRIWSVGGDAELHVWAGGFHGFDAIAPTASLSLSARRARIDWLRRTLR